MKNHIPILCFAEYFVLFICILLLLLFTQLYVLFLTTDNLFNIQRTIYTSYNSISD